MVVCIGLKYRKWDLTERMVQYHCKAGRIEGAVKVGAMWLIRGKTFEDFYSWKM